MRRVILGRLLAAAAFVAASYAAYVVMRALGVAIMALAWLLGRGPSLEGLDVARTIFFIQ